MVFKLLEKQVTMNITGSNNHIEYVAYKNYATELESHIFLKKLILISETSNWYW